MLRDTLLMLRALLYSNKNMERIVKVTKVLIDTRVTVTASVETFATNVQRKGKFVPNCLNPVW